MGQRDFYKQGDWNATCDRCGFKRKASELKLEWDGLRVCEQCWEPRQPQDFVRARSDPKALPWTRPEPADTFIDTNNPVRPSDL